MQHQKVFRILSAPIIFSPFIYVNNRVIKIESTINIPPIFYEHSKIYDLSIELVLLTIGRRQERMLTNELAGHLLIKLNLFLSS